MKPGSKSYPVLAAADASGVRYDLALRSACADIRDWIPAFQAMCQVHGFIRAAACCWLIVDGQQGGVIVRRTS